MSIVINVGKRGFEFVEIYYFLIYVLDSDYE